MKKIIQAIKAFFAFKKLIKSGTMTINTFQKIWTLIGAVVLGLNISWIPDWFQGLFEPSGTQAIFALVSSVITVIQFLPFRTGGKKAIDAPAQLVANKNFGEMALYAVLPFWPAKAA